MTETVPLASQDTITTMAFGRKVLMLGTVFGQDVLALADAAATLVLLAVPHDDPHSEHLNHTGVLAVHLRERGKDANVLLHVAPWREILPSYAAGQFGLAVVNPAALGEDDPAQLIEYAFLHAATVVVIEPSGATLWDAVTPIAARYGRLCTGDGAIIVCAPMPTEPTVRRD